MKIQERYEIQGELGSGGFATVYKALDLTLNRTVAVKVMRPILMSDEGFISRFKREAQTAANLEHPHIIPIYDYGEYDGRLFLVMKYMNGGTIEDWLVQKGAMSWEQTLAYSAQIAEALDFAHERGHVHRDLKPANIFVDERGAAMLGDFGVVKAMEGSTLTQTISGGILGTPSYVPPEIWEGQEATYASDIYALACMIFEMLTANQLYAGETPFAIMSAIAKPPRFPEQWPVDVPAGLEKTLNQALARNPIERYATAGGFVTVLQQLTTDPLAETYNALLSALVAQNWKKSLALAETILAADQSYQDVHDKILPQIVAGQANAQKQAMIAGWRQQAEIAAKENDWDEAKVALHQWLKLDPDNTEAQAFLTRISAVSHPQIERIAAIQQEISIAETQDDWDTIYVLADEWLLLAQDSTDALTWKQKAIKQQDLHRRIRLAQENIAEQLAKQKELTRLAEERVRKVNDLQAQTEAAVKQGNWIQARELATEWLNLDRDASRPSEIIAKAIIATNASGEVKHKIASTYARQEAEEKKQQAQLRKITHYKNEAERALMYGEWQRALDMAAQWNSLDKNDPRPLEIMQAVNKQREQ